MASIPPTDPPPLDFSTPAEIVRIVAEGERLAFGHLVNPAFAIETSLIDPLPHQRIAVYRHLLTQSRLRFLLADDAGAGKTIMAGLYIREMLARRLIRRVLIVPPAGLVGNWESELAKLFNLSFEIIGGGDARSANPFAGAGSDQVIVSVDTLSGKNVFSRLKESSTEPYDLIIFDEAHKLAADRQPDFTIRRTERYRLAEALAGIPTDEERWSLPWAANHLLLLTATPHMGKDFPYYCLWRLLEPDALATLDAFHSYPPDARRRHFIRRSKEEMVTIDGKRLYPERTAATHSYDLTQGPISEQTLYDQTTDYIQSFYNLARILNRSAARLAMSVFQRRLASSTYALRRSFERRLERLNDIITRVQSGQVTMEELQTSARRLDNLPDILDSKTGDEEESEDGVEENEAREDEILSGVLVVSLAELEAERQHVKSLLDLAVKVEAKGDESKFEKLREIYNDPQFKAEKLLIFTEHRDTLQFLVKRLSGVGYDGQIAQLHGGMDYKERGEQVAFFKKPIAEGGAQFLVATDAAGEGINLQFCWLMVNYDIPWNPARLEQRMGRIHRYKQTKNVQILNIIAGKTREGRVLHTLLEKLESIRRELQSDKVFDVIGRLFEGVSLREYLEQAITPEGATAATKKLQGTLTKEQVAALAEQEKRLYGNGGDVKSLLPAQAEEIEQESWRRLLPGYVRRFVVQSLPLLDVGIVGDPDQFFALKPEKPHALDPLWPTLETYPEEARDRLTLIRPTIDDTCIFLRPGEAVFDRLRNWVRGRFGDAALRGGLFVDPHAEHPYFFHFALISVNRAAEPAYPTLAREEWLAFQLIGLRTDGVSKVEECPVEQLLLLRGGNFVPPAYLPLIHRAGHSCRLAEAFATDVLGRKLADAKIASVKETLAEREDFVSRGFDFQDAELAAARAKQTDKFRAGDPKAKEQVTKIRDRQQALQARKEMALAVLRREPELIGPGDVAFLAHALVVPPADEVSRKRYEGEVNDEIEAVAVKIAWAHEVQYGATVQDVSTPELALRARLIANPGFDLLSTHPQHGKRAIEVKGRAGVGDVELTENEWIQACNHRNHYWLYVVFDCATPNPRLVRVQDPFGKLVVKAKGSVVINSDEIIRAAEII